MITVHEVRRDVKREDAKGISKGSHNERGTQGDRRPLVPESPASRVNPRMLNILASKVTKLVSNVLDVVVRDTLPTVPTVLPSRLPAISVAKRATTHVSVKGVENKLCVPLRKKSLFSVSEIMVLWIETIWSCQSVRC